MNSSMSRLYRFVSLSIVAALVLVPAVALCDGQADAMPCCPDEMGPQHPGPGGFVDTVPGSLDCCVARSEAASSPALCISMTKLDTPARAQTARGWHTLDLSDRDRSKPDPSCTPFRTELELASSLLL